MPVVIAPSGKSVECEVDDFVPVLRPGRLPLPIVDKADEFHAAADPVLDAAAIPVANVADLPPPRSARVSFDARLKRIFVSTRGLCGVAQFSHVLERARPRFWVWGRTPSPTVVLPVPRLPRAWSCCGAYCCAGVVLVHCPTVVFGACWACACGATSRWWRRGLVRGWHWASRPLGTRCCDPRFTQIVGSCVLMCVRAAHVSGPADINAHEFSLRTNSAYSTGHVSLTPLSAQPPPTRPKANADSPSL